MADDVYYCSNCGGVMVFDINTQMLKCPNCDATIRIVGNQDRIVEHRFTQGAINRLSVQEKTSETKQCKGCGAMVEIAKDCTAAQCPYCGADYVLADKQEEAVVPDGVIPFKIDKHAAGATFNKWISKRWLAPGTLKQLYESDRIQGVYIPYWTFDADIVCDYSAEGGKHRKVQVKNSDGSTSTQTETDWYHTHGRVKKFFDDVQVKATKNMKSSLLEGIEPYDTKNKLVSYSPQYLSGFGAECYTISLEDAHREANVIMENELRSMARQDVRRQYDEVRNVRIAPDYRAETFKHILIPVYATAYTYKNKNYTVCINGQSGKIRGDYPKSPVKIAVILAIIIALLAGFFGIRAAMGEKKNRDTLGSSETGVYLDYRPESETIDRQDTDLVLENLL